MDLAGQAVLQGFDVGDDADELIAPGQTGQRIHGLFQAVRVQRAEALVDEQRLDDDAAGVLLDRVADTQCQAQRGHKALAAGQAPHRAGLAGVGVEHVQIQRGLAAHGLALAAQQTVLTVGHAGKTQVCGLDHAVKIERLDVLFKGQFDFTGQVSVDGFGQVIPHGTLFAGDGALPHRLLQRVDGGAVRVQAVYGGIPGLHGGGSVAAQPGQRVLQLGQRIGVVPLGHRLAHLLHPGGGGGVARLGVGGAAVGRKALFFQISQLAVQNFRLLRQIFGAVGLLLQLQVVGLQATQAIGQALLLGRQGVAQLVGGQFGGGLSGVAVSAASEKSIYIPLQSGLQFVGVGCGVTGRAAGGGSAAALGRQFFLALLQLFFGDMILRQRRDFGVPGRAADRAGLAVFQVLGQQTRAVGVYLTLHRAVFFLSGIQRSLGGHVLRLAGSGVMLGFLGVGLVLQQPLTVGGKSFRQLNAVVGLEQVSLGLAQGRAVGLVFGDVFF